MTQRLAAMAMLALALTAGAASAQPPLGGPPGPRGAHGPAGFGLLEFDANADGKLTRAELETALKARFDKIDANKDGVAAPEEIEAAGQTEAAARRAERSKQRFAELDKDKNGQLSQAEFAAGAQDREERDMGPHHAGGRPPMAGFGGPPPAFKAEGGPGGFGPPGGKDQPRDGAPRRAGPRDGNADGKVTFAEFSKGPLDAFARVDQNKDGILTISELQAFHGGKR